LPKCQTQHFDSWEEVIPWDIHFATTHKAALLAAFEEKRYDKFINSDSVVKYTNSQGKTSLSVNRQVYYLCGPAGCGKTEGVKRKFGDDEVCGYCVVSYTKTIAGKRKLYLSERAKKYLKMILDHNECNGFNSE